MSEKEKHQKKEPTPKNAKIGYGKTAAKGF